ncbi:MAG: nucleotidyltransferase domain-containing protein [Bryobacteraceae bacterium]|jgi:uncharacterized protein
MSRDEIIALLQAHRDELRSVGVVGVSLFGSMARGEKTAQDIDVAVRLAKEFSRPGFDYFGRLEALEEQLRKLLGCEVDLVEEPVRRERLQREIDKDRAVAF